MPMAHDQNCHLDTITQKKYLGWPKKKKSLGVPYIHYHLFLVVLMATFNFLLFHNKNVIWWASKYEPNMNIFMYIFW
jgi:hypothetical protein